MVVEARRGILSATSVASGRVIVRPQCPGRSRLPRRRLKLSCLLLKAIFRRRIASGGFSRSLGSNLVLGGEELEGAYGLT